VAPFEVEVLGDFRVDLGQRRQDVPIGMAIVDAAPGVELVVFVSARRKASHVATHPDGGDGAGAIVSDDVAEAETYLVVDELCAKLAEIAGLLQGEQITSAEAAVAVARYGRLAERVALRVPGAAAAFMAAVGADDSSHR
jgi:hypothetical protein